MNGPIKIAVPLVAALAIAACSGGSSMPTTAGLPGTSQSGAASHFVPEWKAKNLAHEVCPNEGPRFGECTVLFVRSNASPDLAGWAPIDFQTRYALPSGTKGAGQIVAIVDAYDNPNIASDLATYRSNFGLGTATFNKYNQLGQQSNYPSGNHGWGLEEDLDVQMVSAACPKCTIYLIEANSNQTSDLDTAEKEAVTLGAHIVSNSWGCFGSNSCVDTMAFSAPHTVYLASAGDSGYGTQAPAALGNVVAVGGTVLSKTGSTYSETAWSGTGSGCATGVTKPIWQHDTGCTYRTMNDISAVAENAAEYDSYGYPGWITVAGTSIASPMMGAVFGLAQNATTQTAAKKFWTQTKRRYRHDLHDITTGGNGNCTPSYLCKAGPGYDGPTGWGTPKGIGAF